MSIVIFIILGGVVGWLASQLLGRDDGVVGSIVIGIIGSFIGSFVSQLLTSGTSYLSLSWSGLLWSLIGRHHLRSNLEYGFASAPPHCLEHSYICRQKVFRKKGFFC